MQQGHKMMNENMAKVAEKSALLFIHGYNNTFADAARRCAQLAYDLPFKGISGFYSWPSSAKGLDYLGDDARARSSSRKLGVFIKGLTELEGIEKLHIIAHSMGNLLLTTTLNNLDKDIVAKIDQIILAAPDIDAGEFKETILPKFALIGHQRTLYASDKDMALQLSEKLRGGRVRLGDGGDALFVDPNLDTIDASNVVVPGPVRHGYIFEAKNILNDLFYILHKKLKPEERRLREIPKPPLKYWMFPE